MMRIENRTGRGCDTPRLHQKEIVMKTEISGDSDEAVTPTSDFDTWDKLFENSNTAQCPITSC